MNASHQATATRHGDGFSLLELVVVVALIGTLLAVASTRLIPYVAKAERVALMSMEGQLRNALVMEAALWIARGESLRLSGLDYSNPMALLLQPPGTYLGELNAPTLDLLPARSWHFDTTRRRLVYRAGRFFEAQDRRPVLHEYVVRLAWRDSDGDARFTPGIDEFHGVRLTKEPPKHPDT